jgi:GTP-binding protein Era
VTHRRSDSGALSQAGAADGPAEPDPRRPPDADPAVARRCGLVAIIGRPNVGKSTLLNALVGQKISITSNKAQTTRHRITGIRTVGAAQFVFVDTPGFQMKHGSALHRTMNRTVLSSLSEVDVVLFVVEAGRFGLDDAKVLALLPPGKPVLLIANKLDAVRRRNELLPWLKSMHERHAFAEFVPMSAQKEADVQRLFQILAPYLPEGPWLHDEDALTDRSERFLAGEIVREKLFRLTGDELPYSCTVQIDRFEEEGDADVPPGADPPPPSPEANLAAASGRPRPLRRIAATIIVERDAHKGMVVGAGGERLKRIGSEARRELEQLLGAKVFLELWVKVRSGWADDEAHLRSFGYE